MARRREIEVRHYYELRTVDGRELTEEQLADMRRFSRRIELTPTSLIGDFTQETDPLFDAETLLKQYFDVFLYFDGSGPRHLMFRLPGAAARIDAMRRFVIKDSFQGVEVKNGYGDDVIVRLSLWEEDGELTYSDEVPEAWLDDLVPLHASLLAGDYSPLWLGWELASRSGTRDRYQYPGSASPDPADLDGLGEPEKMPPPLAALDEFLWPPAIHPRPGSD
ncbi:hypothetical protein AB0395_28650 [Streptosporangium sp. NPDC051023]|uniref:hypothetical protein n=1 Tax=Streptosporangium sp. NPDC051023 TaxID=3155410 RepID=UPI00344DF248